MFEQQDHVNKEQKKQLVPFFFMLISYNKF